MKRRGVYGRREMKKLFTGPIPAFGCVCIALILVCTFFVGEAHAATTVTGSTTKKEQTVKLDLKKGAVIVTVGDTDSWVFAQLQKKGGDTMSEAVGGEKILVDLGMEKSFVAPVKKAGTYYLYLHGKNDDADYSVKQITSGGTLTNGKTKTGTSFADNKTVVWHTIKIKRPGQLRVTVKDASRRYPGYSKVRLKKDDVLLTNDEHLIRGFGFSTVYAVSKGTYKIGVRSSSELYKITAEVREMTFAECGGSKSDAVTVKPGAKIYGKIEPGDATESWYKVTIPAKTSSGEKHTITVSAANNNAVTSGGISVVMHYKQNKDGETVTVKKTYLLNNSKKSLELSPFKDKKRNVYIGVSSAEGATGTFSIYWK